MSLIRMNSFRLIVQFEKSQVSGNKRKDSTRTKDCRLIGFLYTFCGLAKGNDRNSNQLLGFTNMETTNAEKAVPVVFKKVNQLS